MNEMISEYNLQTTGVSRRSEGRQQELAEFDTSEKYGSDSLMDSDPRQLPFRLRRPRLLLQQLRPRHEDN